MVITKNAQNFLERALKSSIDLVDEIIVIDDYSTDNTVNIAKSFKARIFFHHEYDLGKQRNFGYQKAKGIWVLVLDADEYISPQLKNEILKLKKSGFKTEYNGYWIRFQTHFLGKPLHYGGETYSKMVLFKKNAVVISPAFIHEKYEVTEGKVGKLSNVIYHNSYESIIAMYKKFTGYGIRAAKQKKKDGEKTSVRKIILYPIHMFWSRFVLDKGYKDGLFRIPLDLGFAYMEFLTYFLLPFV